MGSARTHLTDHIENKLRYLVLPIIQSENRHARWAQYSIILISIRISMSISVPTPRRINKPYTLGAGWDLELRIYPDKRPGNLEIASLHKGLILIQSGVELVEEGAGFGVPVARFKDKTYFSGSATLTLLKEEPPPVIQKSYILDTVSVRDLRGGARISDSLYHPLHRAFTRAYLSRPSLRPLFNKVMESRIAMGVTTKFVKATPRGVVDMRFTLREGLIEVEAVTNKIASGCEELVILNEQGASTFRRYRDDGGLDLLDDAIGAWDKINTPEGTLSDVNGKSSFSVEKLSDSTVMYRGREKVRDRLSWTGIALSLKPGSSVKYVIRLQREK